MIQIPSLSCFFCGVSCPQKILFQWSACSHKYCASCASTIVNNSLSTTNTIPKCIVPDCNTSLKIEHGNQLKSLLLPRYQIKATVKQYFNQLRLVNGYVRQYQNSYNQFPNDLTLIISDYVNLIHYSPTNCCHCNSKGFHTCKCDRCNGKGKIKLCCAACKYFRICNVCNGNGNTIDRYPCNHCGGGGKRSKKYICEMCDGSGQHAIESDWVCDYCDGTGSYNMIDRYDDRLCDYCNGKGYEEIKMNCIKCCGHGRIEKRYQRMCVQCKGNLSYYTNCVACTSTGIIEVDCTYCKRDPYFIALDYNKTCNKQICCDACGQYYTKNFILKWSDNCGHNYCVDCGLPYIEKQITKRIKYPQQNLKKKKSNLSSVLPTCPIGINNITCRSSCQSELNMKYMTLLRYYTTFKNDDKYFKTFCIDKYIDLCDKLNILSERKYKFYCEFCLKWKDDKEYFVWNGCGHEYCLQCAKQHISTILPESISAIIWNGYGNIPQCKNKFCDQLLNVSCCQKLKLTNYQIQRLKQLRIDDKQGEHNNNDFTFELVQRATRMQL